MQASPPSTTRTAPPSRARLKRRLLVVAVAAVIVLSVAAVAIVLLQRETLQIEATGLVMSPDAPQVGMTQLHVNLVLRNVGTATVHLQLMTLWAYDPHNGTLFDAFPHDDVQLVPGETRTFSEVASLTGLWSEAALTVKLFPVNAPSWAAPLVPDEPVAWTA